MSGYIGTQPVPQATQTRDSFTATSGQTSFATGGYTPNFLDVYLNGVKLASADYTATNGSDVVLASGASTGDILEVVAYTAFDTANVTGATNFTVTGAFTSQGIDDNGNAVALTIDSNENVLVGVTSSSANMAGIEIGSNGQLYASTSSSSGHFFNRQSTDGNIVSFRKDGATVGSIGTNGSDLYIGSTDSLHGGVTFAQRAMLPNLNGVTPNDGGTDLGGSSNRWRDAYLSGGVYLGGTGSANKLEDYEEGGGTPSVGATVSGTISYSNTATYKYVKIGSLVTFNFEFQVTATGTGAIRVSLPFTPNAYAAGSLRVYNVSFSGTSPFLEVVPNDARAIFFSNTNNSATSSIMSTGFYYGAITYTTDS